MKKIFLTALLASVVSTPALAIEKTLRFYVSQVACFPDESGGIKNFWGEDIRWSSEVDGTFYVHQSEEAGGSFQLEEGTYYNLGKPLVEVYFSEGCFKTTENN